MLRDTFGMRTCFCFAKQNRIGTPSKKEKITARAIFSFLVGMTGFEPATSCSQSTRATNCATSRKYYFFDDRIRFSLRLGHAQGKTTLSCLLTPSRRFATRCGSVTLRGKQHLVVFYYLRAASLPATSLAVPPVKSHPIKLTA